MVLLETERVVVARSVLDEIISTAPLLREYIRNITVTAREAKEVEEIGNRRRIVTGDGWIEYQNIEDQDRLEESQKLPHLETWGDLEVEVQKVKLIRHSGPKLILEISLGDGSITKLGIIRPALDRNGRLSAFLTILHSRNNINNTTKY